MEVCPEKSSITALGLDHITYEKRCYLPSKGKFFLLMI